MKKCKRKWKKRVMLGALAAGGAYAVVKTRNAYHGIMKMVEETDDDERKIMEKFAKSYHYIGSAEEFTGATVGAVCCSLHLEMQNARIEKDCEIELGCLMSSVVIFVPEKVHVVVDVKMRSGVTRWTMENGLAPGTDGPTLYIHGTARMSSVLVQTLPSTKESEESAPADKTVASDTPSEERPASEETKDFAEDLPSGGPIVDDEPAEEFDSDNETVRVIHIADLDEVVSIAEAAEPKMPETSVETDEAAGADDTEASEDTAEPEEETSEAEEAEIAEEEIPEAEEAEIAKIEEFSETQAAESEEEITEEEEASETQAAEPEVESTQTEKTAEAESAEPEEELAEEELIEAEPAEDFAELEAPIESVRKAVEEIFAEGKPEREPVEESKDEATAAPLEEDLDEDDDFAGDDRRKRMSQDQIDAILDKLAEEYEERGGEE